MKKHLYYASLVALGITATFSACHNHNDVAPDDNLEHKFIRVMVSDESTTDISYLNPRTGGVTFEKALYPKSALYTTASGRFGVVVHREKNYVQVFDTGFEQHSDHVDVKGTPKWGTLVGQGKQPTHFKSKGNEVIIFNDGDGTLDIAQESDFHTTGAKMKAINANNLAHHGAMTKFDNGTYAITEKDGSVAGTLPERVKIVDATGKQIFASSLQTKGIHGNASDGKVALFGSASGILVVDQTGTQRLIPHPSDFGTAWFGTILEGGNTFVGYTAAMGAYVIDVTNSKITPIVLSKDIMQCKVDYAGNVLVVLLHSGEVQLYNIKTNQLIKSGTILSATDKGETQKPQIEATTKYLYVTQPKTGEIIQIEIANFSNTKKVKVSGTPYRLAIVGIESSAEH
ncbi:hypothetical protein [Runella sp. SP2]|uniref:hypothetical protein n=1 Tax=Runella sp. SP2 TaxID=2268026 RepID=UPI000F0796FE|nr:hypothetical protein [Runella sp. SP2]AYQ32135.1 hypothetical protein DTQ70_08075 [Runella sp. SP2]